MQNAIDNKTLDNAWTGTEGAKRKDITSPRDNNRRKFRIAPDEEECILLMQILPDNADEKDYRDGLKPESRERIYVIGRERQNLVARSSGTLRFAVNDIALTEEVINNMYSSAMRECGYDDSIIKEMLNSKDAETAKPQARKNTSPEARKSNKNAYNIGPYPESKDSCLMPLFNELLYYKFQNFYEAWYVDNIGSFLVVIEHKRAK